MSYYIKNIWGPGGQEGYPFDDDMHFAENQRSMAERFADCDGFLVYETGHRKGDIEGAKTIYGKGVVTSNEAYFNKNGHKSGTDRNVEEKVFSYTVKIKLNLRVNPKKESHYIKYVRLSEGQKKQCKGEVD